ncbi:MAG: hypothetical protein RL651_1297 [Pseudomonadota bacterium]
MKETVAITRQQRLIVYCVGLAAFLFQFEAFLVHIALPDMQRELMVDDKAISQVVTTYLLGAVMALFPGGALGCRVGFSRLFWIACLIATLGTLVCGISTSLPMLWMSRLLQGLGIGLMVSSGYTLIPLWVEAEHLGWGYSVISQGAGLGMVFGLPLGGLVAQFLEWHWVFLAQLPLLLGLCVFSRCVLPSDAERKAAVGPGFREVWALLRQVPVFFYGLALLFLFQCVLGGTRYLLPFYLENMQQMSAVESSMSMLLYALMMMISAYISGRYSDHYGSNGMVLFALVLATVSSLLFAWLQSSGAVLWVFMLIGSLGAATGFFASPNSRQIMCKVPRAAVGQTAALLPIALNLGVMIGVFLFQAILQVCAGYDVIYAGAGVLFMLLALLQIRISFFKN